MSDDAWRRCAVGAAAVRARLADHPRAALATLPTPIQHLSRLSRLLGVEVYALRDDLTGFALGGNKVRKVQYVAAAAAAAGHTHLVLPHSSSFSRNAAAAAAALGLGAHVLVDGSAAHHNPLCREYLDRVGAVVHYTNGQYTVEELEQRVVAAVADAGGRAAVQHPGGSTAVGALGYVEAYAEVLEWCARHRVFFTRICFPTGSAGTQAGLLVAQRIARAAVQDGAQSAARVGDDVVGGAASTAGAGPEAGARGTAPPGTVQVVAVAISQPSDVQCGRVLALCDETAALLGAAAVPRDAVQCDERFLGEGYGKPTPGAEEAARVLLRHEGIVLDTVYGGKAAAALLSWARNDEITSQDTVLFIVTGGNGGAYY